MVKVCVEVMLLGVFFVWFLSCSVDDGEGSDGFVFSGISGIEIEFLIIFVGVYFVMV